MGRKKSAKEKISKRELWKRMERIEKLLEKSVRSRSLSGSRSRSRDSDEGHCSSSSGSSRSLHNIREFDSRDR
ncbi:unnamed protein product, partial [Callosobruchus maculatus]